MKKVVVVAPTFNEEENIKSFLEAILAQGVEVLIADSHSTDKTAEIVKSFKDKRVSYLDVKDRGLGLGLSKGIDYAVSNLGAEILVTMEADLSNDPKQLPEFLRKLEQADLVVGSRYVRGGKIVNWSWWRRVLSLTANLTLGLIALNFKVHEYTNLYRAFTKEVWQQVKTRVAIHKDWLFVPSFIYEALGTNFKIVEQPIVYYDRFGGRSKMKTLSYTVDLLHYAIRYRIKKSASVFKFAVVGGSSFLINTIILIAGVHLGMLPSIAGPLGAEVAIIFGFAVNNFWTFSENKLTSWTQVPFKFIQYNVIALGSVVIQFVFLRIGEILFGLTRFKGPIIDWPIISLYSWYMFFYMWGVGFGMVWNYIMYSKVVWRKKA